MGLDYVDIFYSHRFDPETPLEETMGALDTAVRQGKALYAGISSYAPSAPREAAAILRELGTPLLIHQPSYSMLNRWVEDGACWTCSARGSRLHRLLAAGPGDAHGPVPRRRAGGLPRGAAASFLTRTCSPRRLDAHPRAERARAGRGQALAQMAIAWVLRDPRVTSALIGASSVEQLEENIAALERLDFSDEELEEIDRHAVEAGINLWAESSSA